jgi:hypothetical protein
LGNKVGYLKEGVKLTNAGGGRRGGMSTMKNAPQEPLTPQNEKKPSALFFLRRKRRRKNGLLAGAKTYAGAAKQSEETVQ